MDNNEFKSTVGISRRWGAREAGRDVAKSTLDKLERKPDFFLLFSTIHYEKHGGFQEFLNGVWDVLPEGTPLVGGTVAGFMNNYGCYTRGATALAASYPNMDVTTGIGRNTKRNPKKAAEQCSRMIRNRLKNSNYNNKFILDIVSSGTVPKMPGLGRTMIIPSKFLGRTITKVLGLYGKISQKGVGKQDEVVKKLVENLPDYSLISGGSTDDILQLRNFQFFNNEVFSNSVCAMAINCDFPISVNTTHGLTETGKKFKITSLDKSRRVIKSIDDKPAVERLFDILNLDKKDLNEHIFKKIFFLPIGFKSKDGKLIPTVAGIFLGDFFIVIFQIEDREGRILNLSGKGLLKAIDENLNNCNCSTDQIKMALFSSCGMRLLALGNKVYTVHDKLKKSFGEKPFLLYYVAGESTFSKENGLNYGNYTFNSAYFK